MKQYIIRLLFKVDASGLKKQLQSISKEAARVGAAMAKSMNRAFKTVAKEGGNASKQVVKSLDSIEKKAKVTSKSTKELGKGLADALTAIGSARAIKGSIDAFARLESGLVKLQSAAQLFGKDFDVIKADLIEIRKEGTLSFETLNYVSRQLLTPAFGLASDQVGEFVKGLRNIAAVEGIYEDLDFALTSFVRGLQTGTAELLENLSPRIRAFIQTEAGGFAKVQKDQAARQKLFNEIFRASTELQAEYEKQLETTALTQKVFNQRLLELSETFGEVLAPIYKGLLEVTSSLVESINSLLSSLSPLGKSFLAAGVAAGAFAAALKGLAAVLGLIGITIAPLAIAVSAVVVGLAAFTISVNQNKTAIEQANERYEDQVKLLKKIKENDPTGKTLEYRNAVNKLSDATYELNKQLAQRLGLEEKLNDKTLRSDEDLLKFLQDEQARLARDLKQEIEDLRAAGFKGKFLGTDVGQGLAITGGEFATGPEVFVEALDFTFSAYSKASYGRVKDLLESLRDNTIAQKEVAERIGEATDLPKGGTPSVTPPSEVSVFVRGTRPMPRGRLTESIRGQLIEVQREYNEAVTNLQKVQQKSLKEVQESLNGVVIERKNENGELEKFQLTAKEYIEYLQAEKEEKKKIAELSIYRAVLQNIYDSTLLLIEGFQKFNGTLTDTLLGLSDVTKALGNLVGGALGKRLQMAGDFFGFAGAITEIAKPLFRGIGPKSEAELLAEQLAANAQRLQSVQDTLKEQLRIQNEQYELQKKQAEVEDVFFRNNLEAIRLRALADEKTPEETAELLRDAIVDEIARQQLGVSYSEFESLSATDKATARTGASALLNVSSLSQQTDLVRTTSLLAVDAQEALRQLEGADPNINKFFEKLTPEIIEAIAQSNATLAQDLKAVTAGFQTQIGPGGVPVMGDVQFTQPLDEIRRLTIEQLGEITSNADTQQSILSLINEGINEGNVISSEIESNTSNLQQVQARGFGAVDVSRGGLAFGRDFIPTAASLISNVGVPAQIGSLSVAAEANKTMDQKMLDSLQNQLIELKAQTNLLAQLTNTDARIVIANAQQAVKATGF